MDATGRLDSSSTRQSSWETAQEKDSVREYNSGGPVHDDDTTARLVHVDGSVSYVDADIIGGELRDMPPGYYRSPQFIGTFIATCLSSMCVYLTFLMPMSNAEGVGADIDVSTNIMWIQIAWSMGSAVSFLLYGRLSDLFGRKWLAMSVSILSLLSCIVGGTSVSINGLIVASLFSGLASGGQLSFLTIIGELVPNKHRGPANALIFLASAPFATFGNVISYDINKSNAINWRFTYFLAIGLNVVALVLFQFLYKPPRFNQLQIRKSRMQVLKELDWIGMFLFIAGYTLTVLGLCYGALNYAWRSALTLGPLLTGGLCIIAFFVYESLLCKTRPLLPPQIFKNKGFVGFLAMGTLSTMAFQIFSVFWPSLVVALHTKDLREGSLQQSILGGGTLLGQVIAGFTVSYLPKTKYQGIAASALMLTFLSALSTTARDTEAQTLAFTMIVCLSAGFIENIVTPGVTLLLGPQDIGLAIGALGAIRSLGSVICQIIFTSFSHESLSKSILDEVLNAAIESGLPEQAVEPLSVAVLVTNDFASVPGMNATIERAVRRAITTGFTSVLRTAFLITIPFTVLLLASSFLAPNLNKYLTLDVGRRLQDRGFRNRSASLRMSDMKRGDASSQEDRSVV